MFSSCDLNHPQSQLLCIFLDQVLILLIQINKEFDLECIIEILTHIDLTEELIGNIWFTHEIFSKSNCLLMRSRLSIEKIDLLNALSEEDSLGIYSILLIKNLKFLFSSFEDSSQ